VLNVITAEKVICMSEMSAMFEIQITSHDLHSNKTEVRGRVL